MEEYLVECKKVEKCPLVFAYINHMLAYIRTNEWKGYYGITDPDYANKTLVTMHSSMNIEYTCKMMIGLLKRISIADVHISLLTIHTPYVLVFFGDDVDKLRSFIVADVMSITTLPSCVDLHSVNEAIHTKYRFVAETNLPTSHGLFKVRAYYNDSIKDEAIVLMVGDDIITADVPVRVHDQCATSEVFGSLRCDCKEQLDSALAHIQSIGKGMVIYLQQEGRGIGLVNKIAAYSIQELGIDTVDANRILDLPDDCRRYNAVKDILEDLCIESICLMTNNPRKVAQLTKLGIKITNCQPCIVQPNSSYSASYIRTKAERMGHLIPVHCSDISCGDRDPP